MLADFIARVSPETVPHSHTSLDLNAEKCRFTRSAAHCSLGALRVVRGDVALRMPCMPMARIRRSTVPRATCPSLLGSSRSGGIRDGLLRVWLTVFLLFFRPRGTRLVPGLFRIRWVSTCSALVDVSSCDMSVRSSGSSRPRQHSGGDKPRPKSDGSVSGRSAHALETGPLHVST